MTLYPITESQPLFGITPVLEIRVNGKCRGLPADIDAKPGDYLAVLSAADMDKLVSILGVVVGGVTLSGRFCGIPLDEMPPDCRRKSL